MTVIAKIPLTVETFQVAVEEMREKILSSIRGRGGEATIGEIAKDTEGFLGGFASFGHGGVNNWFYNRLTAVACAAMCELVQDHAISVIPTDASRYSDDPHRPKFRAVKKLTVSNEAVWLPVVISTLTSAHSIAHTIFISDEVLSECLLHEALAPLISKAADDLNVALRNVFFADTANRLGLQDYDLVYSIGSHEVEVCTLADFRETLAKAVEANPQIIKAHEIELFMADPMSDEKRFQPIYEEEGRDYGLADYRLITDSKAPIAVRRQRWTKTPIVMAAESVILGEQGIVGTEATE